MDCVRMSVFNLSDLCLTKPVLSLLNKCLNFNFNPTPRVTLLVNQRTQKDHVILSFYHLGILILTSQVTTMWIIRILF